MASAKASATAAPRSTAEPLPSQPRRTPTI